MSISPLLISLHDASLLTTTIKKLNPSLSGSMHAHLLLSKPCRSVPYPSKFLHPHSSVQSLLRTIFFTGHGHGLQKETLTESIQDLLTRLDGVREGGSKKTKNPGLNFSRQCFPQILIFLFLSHVFSPFVSFCCYFLCHLQMGGNVNNS